MTDIGDILGLSRGGGAHAARSKAPKDKKAKQNVARKKIPRLLYNLLGDQSQAAAIISSAPTRALQKHHLGDRLQNRAVSILRSNDKLTWRWKPFSNSARRDNEKAKLSHWKRSDAPTDIDYQFSRFNEEIIVVAPMENETDRLVATDDWSLEETKKLLAHCHKYELRWPVIYDRWDGKLARTEEALKTRYFEVAKAILSYRFEPGRRAPTKDTAPLPSNDSIRVKQPKGVAATAIMDLEWNANKEKERVQLAEQSFRLTKSDEDEAKRLKDYIKRIDIELRKLKRERSLMNKREGSSKGASTMVRGEGIVSQIYRAPSENLPRPTFGPGSDGNSIVYLRSSRLANVPSSQVFEKKMVGKIAKVLNELGVPSRPLPTQRVCDAYDKLRQDIIKLLTARKYYHNKNSGRGRKVPVPKVQEVEEDLLMPSSSSNIYDSGLLAVPEPSSSSGGTTTAHTQSLSGSSAKNKTTGSTASNSNKSKSGGSTNSRKRKATSLTIKGPKKRSRPSVTHLKDSDDEGFGKQSYKLELPISKAANSGTKKASSKPRKRQRN